MPDPRDPLELAARALRERDRTKHELDERLARAGVEADARAAALEQLAGYGYVDDLRVATRRAETLAGRGHGDAAIRADLEARGTAADAVEQALTALPRESERARALAERDGRTPKTARRLAAKGFSAEAVEEALGPDVASGNRDDV